MTPIAPTLFAGAAAVALLELDATSALQIMVSRPAVFGPALGAAFGQAELGTSLGAIWELMTLDEVPIGGHLPVNATTAAGGCLLLCVGAGAVAPEAAFACGVGAGLIHRGLETALRRRRAACAARCEKRLSAGRSPALGRMAAGELAKQAGTTFALLSALLLARPWLAAAWPAAPDALHAALRLGLSVCPWIGCAALLRALRMIA